MGTRGAFGFFKDGVEKVTYCHFDSYPDGLGKDILQDMVGVDTSRLSQIFANITLVDEDVKPSQEQIEQCKPFANLNVSKRKLDEWYCLLREAQGKISVYVQQENPLQYMIDSKDFLKDSLFCEYAYIVNVNTNTLEVYKGFNESQNAEGRYASMKAKDNGKYFGVRLVLEIPLSEIVPENINELVKKMQSACGEDEE